MSDHPRRCRPRRRRDRWALCCAALFGLVSGGLALAGMPDAALIWALYVPFFVVAWLLP